MLIQFAASFEAWIGMHSPGTVTCGGPGACVNAGLTWSDGSPVDLLPFELTSFGVKASMPHVCFAYTPSTKKIGPKSEDTCTNNPLEKGYICQFDCAGEVKSDSCFSNAYRNLPLYES